LLLTNYPYIRNGYQQFIDIIQDMPYRRLPNTDAARIRAMKIALEKGKELPPHKMAFSSKTLVRLQKFLPQFENGINLQRQSASSQNTKGKNYNGIEKKARLYLTHFLRVMNMAIFRGELPVETRAYYGLATNEAAIPSINTENELLSWGKRIIEGEEFRIKKGGSPITNPTIAVVKVRFEQFIDAMLHYQTLNNKTLDYALKNSELRKEADQVILSVWNEVEAFFINEKEESRRKECEAYGLTYFFRKGELNKTITPESQNSIW
jgi:hypothetical protein